ncbi:hypothetical protein Tco_1243969 [Tanacetum coccineum]
MVAAVMKHMASNFAKLDKFEGMVALMQPWNKSGRGPSGTTMNISAKSYNPQWSISLIPCVWIFTKDVLSSKELWDSLKAKYMDKDASSKKFLEELTLVELGSHLRIEESLRAQDSDNPKGNNVVDPQSLDVDWVKGSEHSKAFRFFVIRPNESVSINSITESRDAIFDENRFSSVPRPSPSIPKGTEDIGGSVVPEVVTDEDGPKTFDEAMKSQDVAFWKEAINDEMDSIMGNNIWVLVDLPSGCKPLGCKWIFKRKLKYHKTIDCYGINSQSDYSSDGCEDSFLCYTDASWISNSKDNSSTSGWVFLLCGGAISWASKKQTCITCSTMESEFVALVAAGKEAEWLRNLILDIPLWSKPISPIFIRCDSAATLAKAYSQTYNGKSRYLGVRHSMIRELITNQVISIEFVRSQQNLVGHLTKGLARDLVIKSAEGMGLKSN